MSVQTRLAKSESHAHRRLAETVKELLRTVPAPEIADACLDMAASIAVSGGFTKEDFMRAAQITLDENAGVFEEFCSQSEATRQ